MVSTVKEYRRYIQIEIQQYRQNGYKGKIRSILLHSEVGKLVQFHIALRKDELYSNSKKNSILVKIKAVYWRRKHNILGQKLGLVIPINTFREGLLIFHPHGIVVHKDSRTGSYCKLHGSNCIGNAGTERDSCNVPIIGDYLDLGVGAKVIGNVKLSNHIIVGANAVVCKSFEQDNVVVGGIPAKIIKVQGEQENE